MNYWTAVKKQLKCVIPFPCVPYTQLLLYLLKAKRENKSLADKCAEEFGQEKGIPCWKRHLSQGERCMTWWLDSARTILVLLLINLLYKKASAGALILLGFVCTGENALCISMEIICIWNIPAHPVEWAHICSISPSRQGQPLSNAV